jgi:hypothetical protein
MKLVRKPHAKDGWYEITPLDAQELLDHRAKNRHLREFRAQECASDIAANVWRENGETIVFDEREHVMDGQTRLRGVVIAGKPITSYCVFGVPYKFFPSLDQGKSRGGSDLAGLMGFKNESAVAAVARLGILHAEKKMLSTGKQARIKNDRLRLYLDRNKERIGAAVRAAYERRNGIVKLVPISQAAFVYYMVSEVHPNEAGHFLDKLATGAGLQKGDALLLFRERMRNLIGQKHTLLSVEKLALLVKSWNAFIAGKPCGTLKWNREVEQFPLFHGEANGDEA